MQTEKDVKEPNSAPARSVLCAQGAGRERRVSNRLNTEFASSCSCTKKYIQNDVNIPILESILYKTGDYVFQLRKKLDVHLIIRFLYLDTYNL